ncbi:MAG: ABC transporter ATP-binding protein [Bradyrhizobiaceae bacterium]|nr:ABC transporter ATP-binding protein [Bradyrhizobiaceae bacterium]
MHGDGALLACAGIHKRFGALVVLDNVDFALKADEAVGIVGPNGAGKTTLLSVLSGAQRPSRGAISFQGMNVTALDAVRRCRIGIARSHQIPRPFAAMSVFENAYVGASAGGNLHGSLAYDHVIDILRLCGMLTIANRAAGSLGLLDRKRLELARALATRPKVLLLDEIGGGLTDSEAIELVATIHEVRRRGIAIVWIEHVVRILVQIVERLICLDAGRVIASGSPHAVLTDPMVVKAYLGGTAA